jgi:hypothetical protein
MEVSRYHKSLRVGAVTVALVLLFDSGHLTPLSKELSDNTLLYLANSIGLSTSVEPNEFNQLMADITAREEDLREREIAARTFAETAGNDYSTYILSIILFILTVLIVLNYALDWTRVRRIRHEEQTV